METNVIKETNGSGYVLLYDIAACPRYKTLSSIIDDIKKDGICIYDSSLSFRSQPPCIVNLGGEEKNAYLKNVRFVDVSQDGN